MLQVRLLGQFDVRADGSRIVIPSRAGQSLFAYLILTAGQMHRREKLAGVFWPDSSEELARRYLRNELWRIRKAVQQQPTGGEYLIADEYALGFNPLAEFWLDAAALAASANDLDSLTSTLALYQGELLPGFYEDWILLERERLYALFENKMQALLTQLIQAARWSSVLEWCEKWIALGQTPEAAYRGLLVAYAATGNRQQVVATYERCRTALEREVGVEPSEETRGLYEEIMRGIPVTRVGLYAQTIPPIRLEHVQEPPAPGEPPFKGLEYFDEQDANLFFGREALVEKLSANLRDSGFLAVVIGASGSGKSSLVRAGLVPALKTTNDERRQTNDWRVIVLTPTAHPLEALALALTRDEESVTTATTLMDDLARDARALHFYLRRTTNDAGRKTTVTGPSARGPRTLLVVDQFEELFTLCHDELEREQFIDNLLYAIGQAGLSDPSAAPKQLPVTAFHVPSLALVLTLRADFYAHLAQYTELRELFAKHQEFIGPMTSDELRRAIEEPAKTRPAADGGAWEFEAGLVDLILRDVGQEPGALPLLSHALLETWKRRSGHTLTLKGYHDAGGVRGAIAQTAEAVYQQLDSRQQAIARNIFLRLTELGEGTEDTRRRAEIRELEMRDAVRVQVREVLNMLADARLITLGQDTAEVAHEALIREWPRLREWLNQDRDSLKLHRNLTDAAREWELLERDEGALYRGARLAQAREWMANELQSHSWLNAAARMNELESAFLDASIEFEERQAQEREAQRQRELLATQKLAEEKEARLKVQALANQELRRRAIFLASVGALAIVLALIAIFFAKSAGENAVSAQDAQAVAQDRLILSEKQRLVAEGSVALEDKNSADLAALLALHVLKNGYDETADRLLLRALDHDYPRLILQRDAEAVWAVDFSPDGNYVLTGGDDKIAHLWDARTGQEIREFVGHTKGVISVKFSPDGKRVITNAENIRVWETETGKELNALGQHLVGWEIAISPDGKYVASGNWNSPIVRMWELETGRVFQLFEGHTKRVQRVQFSPDGKKLLTVGLDGAAILWDTETGREIRRLIENAGELYTGVFSPDGKTIAAAGLGKKIWLWDTENGKLIREYLGHQAAIEALVFLPGGKYLASSGDDLSVRLWSVETGESVRQFLAQGGVVPDLSVSPDGTYLATVGNDGKALLWEIFPAPEPLVIHDEGIFSAAPSPDGKWMAVSVLGALRLYDATSGGKVRDLADTDPEWPIDALKFSPDGEFLFGRYPSPGGGKVGQLWDAQTGEVVGVFRDTLMGSKATFSPDGKYLLTASEGTSDLWDSQAQRKIREFSGHPGAVGGVAFSPDGKFAATTSELDKNASLWDLYTGKEIRTFSGHTAAVEGVDFSPDGKQLVTASQDKTLRLWDIASGKELRQFLGHTATVRNVRFSPDGKLIASGGDDNTAHLWEATTGKQVREFTTQGKVNSLEFFPDGKRVMVVSDDGAVRIWRLDLNEVIQMACARLPRDLDATEIQEYNIRDYVLVCPKK